MMTLKDLAMSRADLTRALCLGLAALSAFAIATALGIHHAFWASMPVWVVAQPWRGVIFERALWRLLGTIIGGAAGLVLISLSPAPWITALGMAALMGAGAALVHLWTGVRNYIALMSAITVAVVVIPALLDTADGVSLAMDRLACTVIGGACVALIVGPFTPRADAEGFRAEGAALAARFRAAAARLMRPDAPQAERELAVAQCLQEGAALETRARLIAAGSRDGYQRMAALDAILASGLALLAAATALRADDTHRQGALERLAAQPKTAADALPVDMAAGPLARLDRACRSLEAATRDLQAVAPSGRDLHRLPAPRNPALALRAASLAVLASLAGSALMIATGSFAAELTAFSMAIFALVLGSMPLPHAMAPKLGTGVVLGALFGTLYRLGLQPHVEGWPLLVASVAPFIALGALARAHPRSAPYALDANMCFMLASQAGAMAAPVPVVLGSGLSMALGTLAMVGCFMLLPRPGARLTRRVEARMQRDLQLLRQRDRTMTDAAWQAIWGRRLLTLTGALQGTGETLPRRLLDLAAEGHAVIDARAAEAAEAARPR